MEKEEEDEKKENDIFSSVLFMQNLELFLCIPVMLSDILFHPPPPPFPLHSSNNMKSTFSLLTPVRRELDSCVAPRDSQRFSKNSKHTWCLVLCLLREQTPADDPPLFNMPQLVSHTNAPPRNMWST